MFRFTIRELVLVSVVCALALGWGIDHWRHDENAKLVEESAQWKRDALQWLWRFRSLAEVLREKTGAVVIGDDAQRGNFTLHFPDGTLVYCTPKGHKTLDEKD